MTTSPMTVPSAMPTARLSGDLGEVAGLGHNIVAVCDVDEKYAAKEIARYPNAKRFKDYRVMFDKMGSEVEAVIIGTPLLLDQAIIAALART